uniref:(northern house mosquito) hypothetical protein n=1 Tax=Culex pipiens TaxID=7175 RepID=A0A8D8K923_CULPI
MLRSGRTLAVGSDVENSPSTSSQPAAIAGVVELQAQRLVRGPAAHDPAPQEPIAALAGQREAPERKWPVRAVPPSHGHQRVLGKSGCQYRDDRIQRPAVPNRALQDPLRVNL